MTSSNSNPNSSTGSAEKKYNTIEYNILTGQLKFIATKETIKLTAGDTVKLNGLGKYLSGLYFVQDVTRQISKEGYSLAQKPWRYSQNTITAASAILPAHSRIRRTFVTVSFLT